MVTRAKPVGISELQRIKAAARAGDEADLASGRVSHAQLRQANGAFSNFLRGAGIGVAPRPP